MFENGQDQKSSHKQESRPSFAEITGQTELKQALLAVGANDDLDGLLIRGEKGTAKSTAVRALGGMVGTQRVIADCPYGCPPADQASQCHDCRGRTDPPIERRPVPLVTLPLGATRERVVGTLSVADALAGEFEFDPGLLARANRGILYVDEVNLLDDHLVDVLLDAAASGRNRVERDGVSVSHPASFTLVGTMNPEEGELRPQLRDRFALGVTVTACDDVDERVEIIDRALDGGETEPPEFSAERLATARDSLDGVSLPAEFKTDIAQLCRDAGIDGHRGDIATARAARTVAALDGRSTVIEGDVRRGVELAVTHRLQSQPFEDPPDIDDLLDDQFGNDGDSANEPSDEKSADGETSDEDTVDSEDAENSNETSAESEATEGSDEPEHDSDQEPTDEPTPEDPADTDESESVPEANDGENTAPFDGSSPGPSSSAEEGASEDGDADQSPADEEAGEPLVPGQSRTAVGEATAPELPDAADSAASSAAGGSTSAGPTAEGRGSRVRSVPTEGSGGIDAAASVRAAAARGAETVQSRDLRQSVRVSETAALVLFVVDASASMQPAMRAAKATLLELLEDAYQHRDEVGFVAFAGEDAEVLLPPTDSVTLAARHLKALPTGDRTPLPAGLRTAGTLLDRADPAASVVVLVTDGKANVATDSPVTETRRAARQLAGESRVLVVDAGDSAGLVDPIVEETDGERIPLSRLSAERIDTAVDDAGQN